MTEPELLRAAGVVAGYDRKAVLQDVSVAIAPSEIVAIIGHNGAGKSTLLRVLFGLLRPWKGDIYLEGHHVSPQPRALRARGIAFVPQGGSVFTGLTVAENLQVASMMLAGGATRSAAVDSIVDLLPQVKDLLPRTTNELSGGERQIVGLAMALVISPRLILLDEPSLGLAPAVVRTVLDRLQTIRQEQRTALLIVEQKIREILRIADRVYVMRNGAVSFSGDAAELRDEQRLRGVYL